MSQDVELASIKMTKDKAMNENKGRKVLKRLKVRPVREIDRSELDKNIFDAVLNYLYLNADKNSVDLNKDIFSHMSIALPDNEKERIWGVLTSSGWVSPIVGFGNAGKIELTKAGFQLMSQFGSYSDYLGSIQNNPAQANLLNTPVTVSDSAKMPGQKKDASAGQKKKR